MGKNSIRVLNYKNVLIICNNNVTVNNISRDIISLWTGEQQSKWPKIRAEPAMKNKEFFMTGKRYYPAINKEKEYNYKIRRYI